MKNGLRQSGNRDMLRAGKTESTEIRRKIGGKRQLKSRDHRLSRINKWTLKTLSGRAV